MEDRGPNRKERRNPENQLKRIAIVSEKQEEGVVRRWLSLAEEAFKDEDEPDPDAA